MKMNDPWSNLEELFFAGLTLDAQGRAQLLKLYEDQPEVVEELYELWNHQPTRMDFLEAIPGLVRGLWDELGEEPIPTHIGAYAIEGQLGMGGMGVVYKAIQPPPLSREVALKVLPLAFCTPSWLNRFQLEQRSLGSLNHPNIATVHEAGLSEMGQPFFVMELLEGMNLLKFCDTHRFDLKTRLRIFRDVCEGVHHAHLRGIIHRDLKPSNILVVQRDDQVLPKVIDFGVAHLLQESTLSSANTCAGTPKYMSPEQASGALDSVDLRTDIFSLGAVLYELLCGMAPLEKVLEQAASLQEQCHIAATVSPTAPASLAGFAEFQTAAQLRGLSPARLQSQLRGELQWLVMTCLAREPENRYESCRALIDDLDAYLANRPLQAAGPRHGYRFRKWLTRYWPALVGVAAVIGLLSFALVVKMKALEDVTLSEQRLGEVQAFSERMFREIGPYEQGPEVKAIDLLRQAARRIAENYAGKPHLERSIRLVLARSFRDLGFSREAEEQYALAEALEVLCDVDLPDALPLRSDRAYNLLQMGSSHQAVTMMRQALASSSVALGTNHPKTLMLQSSLATLLGRTQGHAEAKNLFAEVLPKQRDAMGAASTETLATMNNYGDLLLTVGEVGLAEELMREALTHYGSLEKRRDPFSASLSHNLALALERQGKFSQAQPLMERTLAVRIDRLGPHHPDTLSSANNLATLLGRMGALNAAIALIRQHLVGFPEAGQSSREYLRIRHSLGNLLMGTQAFAEAETVLTETWHARKETFGEGHLDTLKTHLTLGELYCEWGQLDRGEAIIQDVLRIGAQSLGETHPYFPTFRQVEAWAAQKRLSGEH